MHRPTRLGSWLHAGLSHAFLAQYWASIRGLRVACRITLFFWLLAHAGLAGGTWGALMSHDPLCVRCEQHIPESQTHCLWSCPAALAIWRAVALLLSRAGMHTGFLSWGTVSWLLHWPGSHVFFEGEDTDVFMLTSQGYRRGLLGMIPLRAHQMVHWRRDEIFMVIVAIAMWNIWRGRCLHVLSLSPQSPTATLVMIWIDLIRSLRSMYEDSSRPSQTAQDRHAAFIRRWGQTQLFFRMDGGHVRWEYTPPHWFILHTSHPPL